jgi:hypothetical protein
VADRLETGSGWIGRLASSCLHRRHRDPRSNFQKGALSPLDLSRYWEDNEPEESCCSGFSGDCTKAVCEAKQDIRTKLMRACGNLRTRRRHSECLHERLVQQRSYWRPRDQGLAGAARMRALQFPKQRPSARGRRALRSAVFVDSSATVNIKGGHLHRTANVRFYFWLWKLLVS